MLITFSRAIKQYLRPCFLSNQMIRWLTLNIEYPSLSRTGRLHIVIPPFLYHQNQFFATWNIFPKLQSGSKIAVFWCSLKFSGTCQELSSNAGKIRKPKFFIFKNFLFGFICWTESSWGPDLKTEKHNWMLFSIHLVLVLQKRDISLPIGSKTTWGGHHQVFLGLTTLKLSAIVSITQTQTLDFFNTWTIY